MPRGDDIHIDVRRQAEGGAEALTIRIGLSRESLRIRETQMGVRVFLDGWLQGGRVGLPGHPTRTFWIALPEGMKAAGPLRAEVPQEHPVASRTNRLAPACLPQGHAASRAAGRAQAAAGGAGRGQGRA